MSHWTEGPLIAFDTETTGTDPQTARILQAAVITSDPSGTIREPDYVKLINPGVAIPDEASAVHGITAEKLAGASPSADAIPFLLGLIQGRATLRRFPLVIYNVPYDWRLLMAECARVPGFGYQDQLWPWFLDPLVIDRALDKYRKGSRKLEAVAAHYGVELNGAHDAGSDAWAAVGIMRALIQIYPVFRENNLEDLQGMQAEWYAAWRDGINAFWERSGKQDRVTGSWPRGD